MDRSDRIDPAHSQFLDQRRRHWELAAGPQAGYRSHSAYYHQYLTDLYRFLVPPGLRILELGCGQGDLIAALKPSVGVGVDLAAAPLAVARERHPDSGLHFIQAEAEQVSFTAPFDVIILSDLLNDVWDVQSVLANVRRHCHSRTRLLINFFNNLWRIPLGVIRRLGKGFNVLDQNWLSPEDMSNLLALAGLEQIKRQPAMLLPMRVPVLAALANRYLARLPFTNWFAMTNILVARPVPEPPPIDTPLPSVSIVVAARNEAGNVPNIVSSFPRLGRETELIFVEGGSTDDTYGAIEKEITRHPNKTIRLFRQPGKGKGDAVRVGFEAANGDILMILDADLTVSPADLPRFYNAIVTGLGDFINGVRLVYPMENKSMRFANILGNKFFSLAFSWLLEQPIKDTLCGTKVLWRKDYQQIAANRHYFGDFDPFGDFDLIFGAAKLNLKICDMPIRYRARTYGDTNISRWRHGLMLLRMVAFAARRIKFI